MMVLVSCIGNSLDYLFLGQNKRVQVNFISIYYLPSELCWMSNEAEYVSYNKLYELIVVNLDGFYGKCHFVKNFFKQYYLYSF